MSEVKWGDVTADTPVERLQPLPLGPTTTPAVTNDAGTSSSSEAAPPPLPHPPAPSPSPPPSALSPAPHSPQPAVAAAAAAPVAVVAAPAAAASPLPSASPAPSPPPSAPRATAADPSLSSLSASLSAAAVSRAGMEESKDEEDPLPLATHSGLHPNDVSAEVVVVDPTSSPSSPSIYHAAATFEALGLSPALLQGVVDMKFSAPSKIQAQALPIILSPNHPNLIGQAHHGSGKCFARGTRLRLIDGQPIAVEVVLPGMQLMGDDGLPRIVSDDSLTSAVAPLYRITPKWDGASPFTVNGDHILVLVNNRPPSIHEKSGGRGWETKQWVVTTDNRIEQDSHSYATLAAAQVALNALVAAWEPLEWEPTVEEYLRASATAKRFLMLTACKAITFINPLLPSLHTVLTQVLGAPPSAAQLDYMSWWLGIWVTDGHSGRAWISQGGSDPPDVHHHHQIFARLLRYQQLFNEPVVQALDKKSSAGWDVFWYKYAVGTVADRVLRLYGLLNHKHVPRALICDTLGVRQRFLAGLIDGDGLYHRINNGYELMATERVLVAGYKELAATLGLRNSAIAVHEVICQQSGRLYRGHRINISGDMWDVAQFCAATYKQCPQPGTPGYVEKNQESRCYGFDITKLAQPGEYFGFAVHGGRNRRFLLEDYTVTHNTAAFSLGVLSRVNASKAVPQALVVVPTRELALQVHAVMSRLAQFTSPAIQVYLAVPAHADARRERERISAHVVVGTPGKLQAKLQYKDIDPRHVLMFVADEADQMVAQEGFADVTLSIKKRLPPSTQILLFSATFDAKIRAFAQTVAPRAIEIVVKTEELSLDSIKQFYVDVGSEADKYALLTSMYGLLEIGQSIVFVHSVATAKALANRMRADGYTVSLLHGKDMQPAERDRVMDDFRRQKTTVLITTNVLARGIDVLSITLVVNFDLPLTKYNTPDPETYIHRIGRSGRFGRRGVAINFVSDDKSRKDLAHIAAHFNKDITQLPQNDIEQLSTIVQQALK